MLVYCLYAEDVESSCLIAIFADEQLASQMAEQTTDFFKNHPYCRAWKEEPWFDDSEQAILKIKEYEAEGASWNQRVPLHKHVPQCQFQWLSPDSRFVVHSMEVIA